MVKADEPTPTPIPEKPEQWSTTAVDKLIAPQEEEKPAHQNPKLDSTLNQLLQVRRQKGGAEAQKFAKDRAIVLTDDRVQVEIIAPEETMNDLIAAVGDVGGVYQGHYRVLLQAVVPIDVLESLVQRPEVQVIRNPIRAVPLEPAPAGSVNTEGLGPANASAWHSAGSTGAGVRVAVIDAGFTNYVSRLGSDLPASVTPYDWTGMGMGGTVHGTACAEVIHDLAPGATMYLHKVSTKVELSQAINQAIADGVDVISMSAGWILDGPGDGTGTLASIVANARSNGILFVTAAGNEAQVSWSGTFSNDGRGNHLWASGQIYNHFGPGNSSSCYIINAGNPIVVGLHWDDWTSVNQDYDLLLYRWTGSGWSLVAGSYSFQNGGAGQTPQEVIAIYAPSTACYGVLVRRYSATRNVCLRLIALTGKDHLDKWVTQRSLTFPADSPNALTVGAVDVSSYNLEPYSSRGPIFGSGGTCSGGGTNPDVVGYANVSTVSYGSGGFSGTSAATPHVAGAAALVLGANPSYSVSQLQSYLENNAVDLGSSGKDNLYGAGRLRLGSPPPLAAPSSLTATPVSASEIDLTWIDNSPNETGFKIERSPNGASGWAQIATVGANMTSYVDIGLTCGTTYSYQVRANNGSVNSNYSNTATAPTSPCQELPLYSIYMPIIQKF
jgi:subtilisin family serine protease